LRRGDAGARRTLAIYLILLLYSRVSKLDFELNLGLKPAFPRLWSARVAG
jgi:hypothetical protein